MPTEPQPTAYDFPVTVECATCGPISVQHANDDMAMLPGGSGWQRACLSWERVLRCVYLGHTVTIR